MLQPAAADIPAHMLPSVGTSQCTVLPFQMKVCGCSWCVFVLQTAGDVWYFPANLAHGFVGLEPDGCLFVSGYKSPDFDERDAFSASTWMATLPVDTIAQVRVAPPNTCMDA